MDGSPSPSLLVQCHLSQRAVSYTHLDVYKRQQLMRDFGSMQSPMNAYMLNLGLESLHVRMQRHCANGMAVAEFLESHSKVAYVNYCGLESSPYHALAEKYLPNGSCGVVDVYKRQS